MQRDYCKLFANILPISAWESILVLIQPNKSVVCKEKETRLNTPF